MQPQTTKPYSNSGPSTADEGGDVSRSSVTEPPTVTELFDALSNERRQYVIETVGSLQPGEHVSIGELADGRAAIEMENDGGGDWSAARKRVYVPLWQNHLPALQDSGLILADPGFRGIHPTPWTTLARAMLAYAEAVVDGGESA